jgi:DNA-binding Lrp family transcriptional regulator
MSKEVVKSNALNEQLIRSARKSPVEIAEETGLSPQEAMARIGQLLEDRGWLTERMEERLLLEEMHDVVAHARKVMLSAEHDLENYASIANAVLKGLQLVAQRMDARKKIVDADIERITQAQARAFGDAFDIALTHVRATLKEIYPLVTDETIDDLAREGLLVAKRELNERVS